MKVNFGCKFMDDEWGWVCCIGKINKCGLFYEGVLVIFV